MAISSTRIKYTNNCLVLKTLCLKMVVYADMTCRYGSPPRERISKAQRRREAVLDAFNHIMEGLEEHPHLKLTGDEFFSTNSVDRFVFDVHDEEKARHHPVIRQLIGEMTGKVNRMLIPDEQAERNLSFIIDDLQNTLKKNNIPKRVWHCYGSYRNGLGCKSSDVDLYYPLHDAEIKVIPRRIEKLLKSSEFFDSVYFMENARVPIIRFLHIDTHKEVDIAFSEIGVSSTKLMKLYTTINVSVKILTLYLKHILSLYQLRGSGKITTTILFWLVVYFMQEKKLLPSVIEIRRAAERRHYVSGWDCSVPDNFYYRSPDSGNVYLLLRDFFKFYRDFDFLKYVICPFIGRSYHIFDFKNLQIPESEFSIYLEKLRNGEVSCFPTHLINLQHPTLLGHNLALQVRERVVNRFKMLCFFAYKRLPDCNSAIPKMPLLHYLPNKLPNRSRRPLNLKQSTLLCFGIRKLSEKNASLWDDTETYVCSVIRKLMESTFGFKAQSITPVDNDQIGESYTSVVFFEYRADSKTWRNFNISHIFMLHNKPENVQLYQQPMCVYIVCEICPQKEQVKIWLQCEVHLNNFFSEYLKKILMFMLKESVV